MKFIKTFESLNNSDKEKLEDYFLILMDGGLETNEPLFKPRITITEGPGGAISKNIHYYSIVITFLKIDSEIIKNYLDKVVGNLTSKYIIFCYKKEFSGFLKIDTERNLDIFPSDYYPFRWERDKSSESKHELFRYNISLTPKK